MLRYRVQEWLNFITSELHKGFGVLFNPAMPEEAKAVMRSKVQGRFAWIDGQLSGKAYLMGEHFSIADAYLYTVSRWAPRVGVDIGGLANVTAYVARVGARPAVQDALKAEGLTGCTSEASSRWCARRRRWARKPPRPPAATRRSCASRCPTPRPPAARPRSTGAEASACASSSATSSTS
jgi:hypothetical protein